MNKIIWLVLAGLMAACAALQLNDPDPLYWVLAYLASALSCLHIGLGVGPRAGVWLSLGVVVGGALTAAPGFAAWVVSGNSLYSDMAVDNVEAAREFIGVSFACAVLIVGLFRTRRGNQPA